jgi:hypothetical protein
MNSYLNNKILFKNIYIYNLFIISLVNKNIFHYCLLQSFDQLGNLFYHPFHLNYSNQMLY